MAATSSEKAEQSWSTFFAYLQSKGGGWAHFINCFFTSPMFWIVILSNMAVFFLPGMDLKEKSTTLIWIYLGQSIMIGIVHALKLFTYKFQAYSGRANDWTSPKALGAFFIVHYGFFHFIYSNFIPFKNIDMMLFSEGLGIFALSLFLNTVKHYSKENSGMYNANDFMFLPYLRIIPIHIAIILGGMVSLFTGGNTGVFIVLAILKTTMEIAMEYAQLLGISLADIKNFDEKKN